MTFDLDLIRSDTPGCSKGIHLLACGSALMPKPVLDEVTDFLRLESELGGYEAAGLRAQQLDGVYDSVAKLIGAKPTEIALVENATVAWCQAFYSFPLQAGDRVLTSEVEYGANYVAMLQRAKRDGIVIDVVPSDESGALDLDALRSMIDDRVKLISLTWIPTNGGLVNPAAGVGEIAEEHGIFYLLDACQAVGQMTVDVGSLKCDALSATGRKFLRGPRGTGFLYMKTDRVLETEPVVIDHYSADWVEPDRYVLRPDAGRFENWENAYALRAGLGVAVDYAMSIGMEVIQERSWALAARLREGIDGLDGGTVLDLGTVRSAIVSFSVDGLDPRPTVDELRTRGISIGASGPASTRLDSHRRGFTTILRAAPHYYNSDDDIDSLVDALAALPRR